MRTVRRETTQGRTTLKPSRLAPFSLLCLRTAQDLRRDGRGDIHVPESAVVQLEEA